MTQLLSTGEFTVKPGGKLPDDTTIVGPEPNGEVQDVTNVTDCLYTAPTAPPGKLVLVMTGPVGLTGVVPTASV